MSSPQLAMYSSLGEYFATTENWNLWPIGFPVSQQRDGRKADHQLGCDVIVQIGSSSCCCHCCFCVSVVVNVWVAIKLSIHVPTKTAIIILVSLFVGQFVKFSYLSKFKFWHQLLMHSVAICALVNIAFSHIPDEAFSGWTCWKID